MLQPADKLFAIEQRVLDSPIADKVWRARSVPADAFISVAASHWELVFWRQAGATHVTMRGPETRATSMPIPAEAEFIGIQFRLGAFMPDHDLTMLVDRSLPVASRSGDSFRFGGADWDIPTYEHAEQLLGKLARRNLVAVDPIVAEMTVDMPAALSRRSVERRVRRATGLTSGTIRQIERAHRATTLLNAGAPIADVVIEAGFADQAHLTRSLNRFVGQTPGLILRGAG